MSSSGGSAAFVGVSTPQALGYVAMSGDPGLMPSTRAGASQTTGQIRGTLVSVAQLKAATQFYLSIVAANAVGVTSAFAGVYDTAWQKLADTADFSASLATIQTLAVPLQAPMPAQSVNTKLWLVYVITATTAPDLCANRANGYNPPTGVIQATSRSGQTPWVGALPQDLSAVMINASAITAPPFVAIS